MKRCCPITNLRLLLHTFRHSKYFVLLVLFTWSCYYPSNLQQKAAGRSLFFRATCLLAASQDRLRLGVFGYGLSLLQQLVAVKLGVGVQRGQKFESGMWPEAGGGKRGLFIWNLVFELSEGCLANFPKDA